MKELESGPIQPGLQNPTFERIESDAPTAAHNQPALEHGALFGEHFKLQRALGSGDEGGVWLAEDLRLSRMVILKLLPEAICTDTRALTELKEITRRSRDLVHPHIARTYEFVEAGAIDAVALEYVEGKTLTQLRLEQPRQVFEAGKLAAWARSLCEALDYAYTKTKLVHGGLRPDNLLVTAGGDLMLIGFGLAGSIKRWLASLAPQTQSHTNEVIARFPRPPERELAADDDVQGVCATLYELLTGTAPLDQDSLSAPGTERLVFPMAKRRAEQKIEGEAIPASWEHTVTACLARDPSQHPENVRELATWLEISLVGQEGRVTS